VWGCKVKIGCKKKGKKNQTYWDSKINLVFFFFQNKWCIYKQTKKKIVNTVPNEIGLDFCFFIQNK